MANVIGDTIVFLFFVFVACVAIPPTVRFVVDLLSTAVAEGIRKSKEAIAEAAIRKAKGE